VQLPAPFPDHHQTAETLLFVLIFAGALPLAIAFVPPLADRIAAGRHAASLSGLTALCGVLLLTALLAVKLSERLPWGGGAEVLLIAIVAWWLLAAALLILAVRPAESAPLTAIERAASALRWILAGLLVVVAPAFALVESVSIGPLLVCAGAAVAVVLIYRRGHVHSAGRWGPLIDLGLLAVVFLAIPNLVVVRPEVAADAFDTQIIQFHQNFFLGPANHVLGGEAMLVDTVSQYGVGSIDLIAGWFALVGVSNGMLGLLDGLLGGLVFAGAYFVVRAAGVRRPLAALGMAFAVVVLVLGLVYPVGGLLQHGAIRFGVPMAVLVAAVAGLRFARLERVAWAVALLFVGVSSIWALEAFAYTAFTFLAVVAVQVPLLPREQRTRWLLRRIAGAAAACVLVQVAFAIATLLWVGHLPEWGQYLSTLRAFLTGSIGDLTYDFSPWSPGLAVGAVYVASTVLIALLLFRRRELAARERIAIVALAGSTAYGIALLSYLVNRSSDHIVAYVSLPALMVVLIWLGLLLRTPEASLRLRSVALGLALFAAALMTAVAWSSVDLRYSQSALAHVLPWGDSTTGAIDRLSDLPPLSQGAADAEDLLDRWWPGQDDALVIAEPDLGVEALAATGRVNVLPLADPWEASFVAEQRRPEVDDALDALEPGEFALLDRNALERYEVYRRHPERDPLAPPQNQTIVPSGLATLQEYALLRIGERFRLREIDSEGPLVVVELVPRRS
jgi:hypothetical protein